MFDAGELLDRLAATPSAERVDVLGRAGGAPALGPLGDRIEQLAGCAVQDAIEAAAMVVDLADRIGGPRERARARRASSHALAYGGRLEESLRAGGDAVALAAGRDVVEAARARLATMQPLCLLGRVDEAVAAGEAARGELLAAGEPALAARAHLNLANVENGRGRPLAALVHLDHAAELLPDDPARRGHVENARGEALLQLDDFTGAEHAFRRAAELYRPLGAAFLLAMIEGNLAAVLARQGRLHDALAAFEAARRHVDADAAAGHAARLLIEQSEAMEALGLPEESIAGFDRGIADAARLHHRFDLGRGHLGRARALLRLGRTVEAEAALLAAAEGFRPLGPDGADAAVNRGEAPSAPHDGASHKEGEVDLIRGELLIASGRAADAQPLLERALGRFAERPIRAAAAEHHLADLALRRGDIAEAMARFDRAISTAQRLDVPTLLADLLHARSRAQRIRGDAAAAILDLRAAVEQVERVRGAMQAERLRAAFLGDRIGIYQSLVATMLDRGGDSAAAEAFTVAEQAKSRSLLEVVRGAIDFAASALASSTNPAEQALAREIAQVQAELNGLYSRLGGDSTADQRRAESASWHSAVLRRERRLQHLEARLAATAPGRPALAAPMPVAEIAGRLPADSALLEYFLADGELLAWVVRPDAGVVIRRRLVDAAGLGELVARLQFQLARALRPDALSEGRRERLARDFIVAARALHDAVVAPIAAELAGVRRVVLVPHGPLHLVPFGALHDGEAHLVERFEWSLAPSAAVWAATQADHSTAASRPEQRVAGAAGPSLIVGVGDASAPRIGEEADALAGMLPHPELLRDADATVEAVLAALPKARRVHMACHGRFVRHAPLSSGLRLFDRWLTVRDLHAVALDAELVVLSGCDTGRSMVARGDELLGLLRGFLAAGATSLVVSLWATNDTSTAELMGDFYRRMGMGAAGGGAGTNTVGTSAANSVRPGMALREAQLAMLRERPHPVHWAPFVMVGRS